MALPCVLLAADADPEIVPTLAGRLAWVSADGLDFVADLEGEVPFFVRPTHDFWFDFGLRTSIEDTTSNFDFKVREIDYYGDVGWRTRKFKRGIGALTVFAGQRGKELVDQTGNGWIRYVAVGVESSRYRDPMDVSSGAEFRWRLALGPVINDQGIDADYYVRGDARFRWALAKDEGPRPAWAFDLRIDGVGADGSFDADIELGPGFEIPTASGQRFLLFAHYQLSEHPFGIGEDAWLFGLEYAEGTAPSGDRTTGRSSADLTGVVAWGGGEDDRMTGQVFLRFLSPGFGPRLRAAVDVDANVLTSADVDDIYWRYDVGLERVRHSSAVGVYLYHRSNHRLGQSGLGFTSRNVVEVGVESDSWNAAGRRPERRGASLDYRLRLGYLVNSTFAEDQRFNVRGGLRWSFPMPWFGSSVPFVSYELERGDIDSSTFAIGISPTAALDFQIEVRDDEQYFSVDQSATLLSIRYGF